MPKRRVKTQPSLTLSILDRWCGFTDDCASDTNFWHNFYKEAQFNSVFLIETTSHREVTIPHWNRASLFKVWTSVLQDLSKWATKSGHVSRLVGSNVTLETISFNDVFKGMVKFTVL